MNVDVLFSQIRETQNRAAHGMRWMIMLLRDNECSKIEQMLPETDDERFRACFDESLL